MYKKLYSYCMLFFVVFIFLCGSTLFCDGAVAITKHGPREGRVLVRESTDRIVVTIVTENKRLYQFYAKDVESVTSSTRNLIGEETWLYNEKNNESSPSVMLTRGLEVVILDEKSDSDWIKINAWGKLEGWIKRDILSDRVIFSPEEKLIPLQDSVSNEDYFDHSKNKSPNQEEISNDETIESGTSATDTFDEN